MPFIPGKLKPRIKPRLGARPTGPAENVDAPKNKPEDPNATVEPLTPKSDEGTATSSSGCRSLGSSSSIGEAVTQPEPSSQSSLKETTSEGPLRQDDEALVDGHSFPSDRGDERSAARSNPSIRRLASSEAGQSSELSGGLSSVTEDEGRHVVQPTVSSAVADVPMAENTPNCTPDQHAVSNGSVPDDGKPSPVAPIMVTAEKNFKNARPIGLKFHKPNLKRLARPAAVSQEQPVANSYAPKVLTADEGTSRLVSSDDGSSVDLTAEPPAKRVSPTRSKIVEERPVVSSSADVMLVSCAETPSSENSCLQASDSVSSSVDNDQPDLKKPLKMLKKASSLTSDEVRSAVDDETSVSATNEGTVANETGEPVVRTASSENAEKMPDGGTTENSVVNSSSSSPLCDVKGISKKSSAGLDKREALDSRMQSTAKFTVTSKTAPFPKTAKSAKGETDDVKVLFAISAVDYLKRHDHALGDSILRRLIIGDKNMENRSQKSTMCSTCNPQTLKKCLSSLWSFDKYELQTIIKKASERQKAPICYAALPGKTLFKPSLGRQRAPTLTASTYGKMSFEVKERLAKQYGSNPPQLSKLRMLDLIFYNPSDNPIKSESRSTASNKGSDSESDLDDPSEEKSETVNEPSVPVPQVRIGDEGQIILAPESLVLKKKESEVLNSPVVEEFSFADSNRKKASLDRTAWSFEETLQFYKALHSLGTDFSIMIEMFPKRTRANLKSKFKREERKNPALVDKVLSAQGRTLNYSDVEKDLAADKTLKRLCFDSSGPLSRKMAEKRALERADQAEKQYKASIRSAKDVDSSSESPAEGKTADNSATTNSVEDPITASRDSSDTDEDAIFKRPSNIRPPRKRKFVKSAPVLPEKRRKAESAGGQSKGSNNEGEDAVFKKPRIPKKRKVPSKKPEEPVRHLLSINLDDEDDESDDTDDSACVEGSEAECLIIRTNVKGENYSISRSIRVNCADPEVPIDVNETIEHDRCPTPMSDSMSETDFASDSEAGEDVEVVSIDVNEIASYLEKTGAVVLESSTGGETAIDDPRSDDDNSTHNSCADVSGPFDDVPSPGLSSDPHSVSPQGPTIG